MEFTALVGKLKKEHDSDLQVCLDFSLNYKDIHERLGRKWSIQKLTQFKNKKGGRNVCDLYCSLWRS